MQSSHAVRALYFLAIVVSVACGSHNPTNFNDSSNDDTLAGSGAGAQGGSAGTAQGGAGSGGAPLGGVAGSVQGGSGAGGAPSGGAAGTPGGSGGSTSGGSAGAGGTNAGSGGTSGSSSGGSGARGGSGGSQTVSFSCGSLMCVADRQYCVRTLPAISGEPEMRMCLPFPDSCTTVNCDCFCKPPMMSPCGAGSVCMCNDNNGQISVLCAGA